MFRKLPLKLLAILPLLLLTTVLLADAADEHAHFTSLPTLPHVREASIEVHNRILWSHRGSLITVMDVVKKMDQVWLRQPHVQKASIQDQFEFYQQSWRMALQDLIDNELIYQDALDHQHQMQVTDAEAKDEIIRVFGTSYLTRLDELGYTLPYAIASAKKDLLINRMVYLKVHYGARSAITPQAIAKAYFESVKSQPETDLWEYFVFTVKGPSEQSLNFAKLVYSKLQAASKSIEELAQEIKQECPSDVKFNSSKAIEQTSEKINQKYLQALKNLSIGQVSEPIEFRADAHTSTYRLILLQSKQHHTPPSFAQLQKSIEDQLRMQYVANESQRYISKLRKQLEREQGESLQQAFNPATALFSLK